MNADRDKQLMSGTTKGVLIMAPFILPMLLIPIASGYLVSALGGSAAMFWITIIFSICVCLDVTMTQGNNAIPIAGIALFWGGLQGSLFWAALATVAGLGAVAFTFGSMALIHWAVSRDGDLPDQRTGLVLASCVALLGIVVGSLTNIDGLIATLLVSGSLSGLSIYYSYWHPS